MAVNNLNVPGVGIQPSLIDAKGDLLVGTGNDAIDRLGVTGPTGSVLVTDAGETTGLKWVDPGTVGGLVHINTTSFSGVSGQILNNIFNSTYDNYLLFFEGIHSTGITTIDFRLRVGGVDNNTSNSYVTQIFNVNSTTLTGVRVTDSKGNIGAFNHTLYNNFVVNISSPALGRATVWNSNGTASDASGRLYVYGGTHNQNTIYDGINFFVGSGNITGAVTVYGYKK